MSRTVRAASGIPLPHLEILLGGAGWVAGSLGFGAGGGTLVMAAGLLVTGWLFITVRRRGLGARLDRELRTRVLRLAVVVGVVLVVLGVGLPLVGQGWGELTVPVGAVVVGAGLCSLSTLLGERSFVAVGAVLVVLGAVGSLLALNSGGAALPLGVVGIGGAVVLWLAGVRRIGLVGELRERVGR
jgi:hypothetical protein